VQARTQIRLGWLALASAGASVLIAARLLTPAPGGVGTHTELGLPPCGFLTLLHVPCPACGLTTAFAHLARGAVNASLEAHPLGLPLFAALALFSLGALCQGLRGEPRRFGSWPSARFVHALWLYSAALLTVWLARLAGR
jgi:hypothetical protein